MFFIFKKRQIKTFATGLIPSPPDRRDILASQIFTLPEKIPPEYPPLPTKILDQNGYPACVGYSCAGIKSALELREKNVITFDGLWIYQKCKEIDGIPNEPGTYFRVGLKVLKDYGAKPIDGTEQDAQKYRIGGYCRLDDLSFEGLKKAIFLFGEILAGFRGSNEGWQSAYVRPPKLGENVWGHAVRLVGYNKNYIIFANSWGEDWGDKGYGYISANYLPFEAWAVLVDLPNDWQTEKKEKPKYFFQRDLGPGMQGEDVKILQQCLKYLGMFPEIINCTGFYGDITKRAVQTFQATYKIQQTGYVGPITRAKLNEIFAS